MGRKADGWQWAVHPAVEVRATPEVVKEAPRYGGIFRGKKLKGSPLSVNAAA